MKIEIANRGIALSQSHTSQCSLSSSPTLRKMCIRASIETADTAAEIYMTIAHLPLVNTITDEQMHQLEAHFGVKAREGHLS